MWVHKREDNCLCMSRKGLFSRILMYVCDKGLYLTKLKLKLFAIFYLNAF